MPRILPSTTSYSGRQLDLEALQSMDAPHVSWTEVTPGVVADTPKIVAGAQKLVQRYAVLFTTLTGGDVMRPDDGTPLCGVYETGNFGSTVDIELMAQDANSTCRARMREDDADEETFGTHPADEMLDDCWIDRVTVDRTTRTVSIFASIRSMAGNEISFVVPTTAGIY